MFGTCDGAMYDVALSCLVLESAWCIMWHYHVDMYVVAMYEVAFFVRHVCHRDIWRGIIVSDTYVIMMYDVALSCLTRNVCHGNIVSSTCVGVM